MTVRKSNSMNFRRRILVRPVEFSNTPSSMLSLIISFFFVPSEIWGTHPYDGKRAICVTPSVPKKVG